jgi:hypothetical protein
MPQTHTPLLLSLPAVLCIKLCWHHDVTSRYQLRKHNLFVTALSGIHKYASNVSLSLLWENLAYVGANLKRRAGKKKYETKTAKCWKTDGGLFYSNEVAFLVAKQIYYNSLSLYAMTCADTAISVRPDACYQLPHERDRYEINVNKSTWKGGSHGM